MNEENYTTPPTKLPDQIFETLEVLNQEPDESKTGMSEFEKMMTEGQHQTPMEPMEPTTWGQDRRFPSKELRR